MAFIRKEGKFYYVYFNLGKKKYKRSTRSTSKKVADDIRKKIENELATGMFKINNYSPRSQKLLDEFFKEAINYSKTNKSELTVEREEIIFNNFLRFCGVIPITNITIKIVEKYKSYLNNEKKFTPNGINIELRHLSAAFSLAVKYGYIVSNPFKNVKKVQIPKKLPRFLTVKQANELLNHTVGKKIYQYILISLNTGARRNEIINLKWEDIDLDNRILKLHGKGSKDRSVPIPKSLLNFLRNIKINGKYVVSGTRNKNEISRQFRNYADEIGLSRFTFHNLRDTYASWLVQNGVNLKIIQELLGHESIQTTLIYAHLAPENKFEAMRVMDNLIN